MINSIQVSGPHPSRTGIGGVVYNAICKVCGATNYLNVPDPTRIKGDLASMMQALLDHRPLPRAAVNLSDEIDLRLAASQTVWAWFYEFPSYRCSHYPIPASVWAFA